MNTEQLEIDDFLLEIETEENVIQEVDLKQCEILFQEKTGITFTAFYNEYYPKLLWFLKSKCTDHFEVEDLVNDSFLKALKNIHKFDPKYKFSTWLYTVSYNILRQYFKDKAKLPIVKDFDDQNLLENYMEEVYTGATDDYRNKLKADVIFKKMDLLGEKQKAALILREVEGKSYQQIADELNINLSTIKSQIRGGRMNIIELVKKEFDYIDEAY